MTIWSQQNPPANVLGKIVVGSSRFQVDPPFVLTSTFQLKDIMITSGSVSAPLMSAALVNDLVSSVDGPYSWNRTGLSLPQGSRSPSGMIKPGRLGSRNTRGLGDVRTTSGLRS